MEALYQALAAQAVIGGTLDGIQVTESFPGGDTLRGQALFLGDVQSSDIHVPTARGPARVAREENYTLDLHAQVSVPGPTAKAAREACYAIYAAVEDILVTNPTLGLDGVTRVLPSSFQLRTGLNDTGGWLAFLRIEVEVQARIY